MKNLCCAPPTTPTQPVLNSASFLATKGIDLALSPDKVRKNGFEGRLYLKHSNHKAQLRED